MHNKGGRRTNPRTSTSKRKENRRRYCFAYIKESFMCLKAILVVVGNRRRPKMRKSSSFFHTFIPTRLFCATLLLLFGGCLLLRGVSAKSRTAKVLSHFHRIINVFLNLFIEFDV